MKTKDNDSHFKKGLSIYYADIWFPVKPKEKIRLIIWIYTHGWVSTLEL